MVTRKKMEGIQGNRDEWLQVQATDPAWTCTALAGQAWANAAGRALPSGAQANSAVHVLAKAALADQVLANGAGSVWGTAG